MICRVRGQDGFTLVELAVVLAILSVVGAAVTSLIGWSVQVQARYEAAHLRQESAQMALEQIARLLRTAGAGRKPALWRGERDSVDLCGLPWAGRTMRASVRLDGRGSLVLAPFQATGNVAGCPGSDLTAPVSLAPSLTFLEVGFRYTTPAGEVDRCSQASSPPCTAVTGVKVRVRPEGAPWGAELFIALRNPGGP